MKKIISLILLLVLLNAQNLVFAKTLKVKNSTLIPISLEKEHTSKSVQSGEKINAIIAEDVKVNNMVIFKRGGRAVLNISDVKKNGFLGNPGAIQIANGQAYDANGDIHTIEFSKKIIGEEKTYPKVLLGVSIFFLWPLALFGFVKGGHAKVTTGDVLDTYLRNDFVFTQNNM